MKPCIWISSVWPFISSRKLDVPSQLNKNRLHGVLPLPLGKAGQLVGVDHAVVGVDARKVDLADELDCRRLIGVVGTAVHLYAVDAVLVDGLKEKG